MAVVVGGVYVHQHEDRDCWTSATGNGWERRPSGLWRLGASPSSPGDWELVGEPMGISDAVRFSIGYDQAEAEEAARSQAALQGPPVGVASGTDAEGVTPLRVVAGPPEERAPYDYKAGLEVLAERLEAEVNFLGRELRLSEEQPYEGRGAIRAAVARELMLMRWRRKLDRLLAEVCEWL